MGVNHDQFSHFSRLPPGSSALILQMVLILAQIFSLVASGLHIISAWSQVVSVGKLCEWWSCDIDEVIGWV